MNKVAFLSVVYPGAENYLDDFFKSLAEQNYKYFDVIILNDGLDDFHKYISSYSELNIYEIKFSDTAAKIREKGIKYIIENKYDLIVFGDCDDYFKSNRLKESIHCLEAYDIVVNDFDLLNNDKDIISRNYLSRRFSNNQELLLDHILDKNCFGLSNTAINTKILKDICFNSELIAVDWYLFSLLLLSGARAVFTDKTTTYYRQYTGNAIGAGSLNDGKVLKGIEVKLIHYREMSKISDIFLSFYEGFRNLENNISKDENFRELYLARMKTQTVFNPLWWEEVRLIRQGQ